MKTDLEILTNNYWNYELELAKIADSLEFTKEQLIDYVSNLPLKDRLNIYRILNNQKNILIEGNKLIKNDIMHKNIVDLNEYRKLR